MNDPTRYALRMTRYALLALALIGPLCGCQHFRRVANTCNKKPTMYANADSIASLKVPPGIDRPDTHAALKIPTLNEPAPPRRTVKDPCLDAPPLYAVPKTDKPAAKPS
jgi:uncharacterized lipoprotein